MTNLFAFRFKQLYLSEMENAKEIHTILIDIRKTTVAFSIFFI